MVSATAGVDEEVEISLRNFALPGRLTVPAEPHGVVVLVNESRGSGSDARDRLVADRFLSASLGTLRLDLIGPEEAQASAPLSVLDLDVLAVRLLVVTRWLSAQPSSLGCRVGYFGVGSGAAIALLAAAEAPAIGAVVSRAGRLEPVMSNVNRIGIPTLFVVGDARTASDQAERACVALRGPAEVTVVPGAEDLSAKSGASEAAVEVACVWFLRYLRSVPRRELTGGARP